MKKICLLIISACLISTIHVLPAKAAQDKTAKGETKATEANKAKATIDTAGLGAAAASANLPSLVAGSSTDSVTNLNRRQIDTVNHYKVVYTKFAFEYKTRLYNWQLLSAKILFGVVIVIVLIGLYLSYLQFKASVLHVTGKASNTKVHATDGATPAEADHTKIEVSKDGIKIDSAVIGLVILTLSIVFFFLYLKFVFPINDAI